MTGFKNFILRGNLVELAVAFIMAIAFTAVVTATVDLIIGPHRQGRRRRRTSRLLDPVRHLDRRLAHRGHHVRDHGRGRLLLHRDAVHEGEGAVLPEPGAGHAGRHPAAQEIRDLLAAQQAAARDLLSSAVVRRHLLAQPRVGAGLAPSAGTSSSRSSLVVSGSTSPKTSASRRRRSQSVSAGSCSHVRPGAEPGVASRRLRVGLGCRGPPEPTRPEPGRLPALMTSSLSFLVSGSSLRDLLPDLRRLRLLSRPAGWGRSGRACSGW